MTSSPSTHPGRIAPGDLLSIGVSELAAPGTEALKPVRVGADGKVRLLYLPELTPVGGMTTVDAEESIAAAYQEAGLVQHPMVSVRRLAVGAGPGAGPIGNFDLLRISVWDLSAPGVETVRIVRVNGDGVVGLPYLGKTKLAGLTDSQAEPYIAEAFQKGNIIQKAGVSVLRLEAAPEDAGQLDLPDAPIYPVPDVLRPLFEPSPASPGAAAAGRSK